jgi:hydrogenase maturation protease
MTGARWVIGVGNPVRGDDALGRVVADRLRGKVDHGFKVLEQDGEMTALLARLTDADAVILIDAAAAGAAPGTIHRFDAGDGPLPPLLSALSTHGFGPLEAVELARAMGSLPPACIIYAVEGADFGNGRPLSPAVAAAAEEVTQRILAELDRWKTPGGSVCTRHP